MNRFNETEGAVSRMKRSAPRLLGWYGGVACLSVAMLSGCADHRHPSAASPSSAGPATVTQRSSGNATDQTRVPSGSTPSGAHRPTGRSSAAAAGTTVAAGEGSSTGAATKSRGDAAGGSGSPSATQSPTGPAADAHSPITATPGSGTTGLSSSQGNVTLWVSRDNGSKVMVNAGAKPAASVLDLLSAYATVQTAYGGAFVNSINGLASTYTGSGGTGSKQDWFYYVNGSLAAVGADAYRPAAGDSVWWDYHAWDGGTGVPAVVGSFPHPFTTGYEGARPGTTVLYATGYESRAQGLASALQADGAEQVHATALNDSILTADASNLIVVGDFAQIASSSAVQGIVSHRAQTGWFANINGSTLALLDSAGQTLQTLHGDVGFVDATGSAAANRPPIWFVTGTDDDGVALALQLLEQHPERLAHTVADAVTAGSIVPVP